MTGVIDKRDPCLLETLADRGPRRDLFDCRNHRVDRHRPRQADELLGNGADTGVDRRCDITRRLEPRDDHIEVLLGEQRDRATGVNDGDLVAERLQDPARLVARSDVVLDDQDSMQLAPTSR